MRKNCSGPIIYLRAVGHIAVVIHHACRMGLPNEPMNILVTGGAGRKGEGTELGVMGNG